MFISNLKDFSTQKINRIALIDVTAKYSIIWNSVLKFKTHGETYFK